MILFPFMCWSWCSLSVKLTGCWHSGVCLQKQYAKTDSFNCGPGKGWGLKASEDMDTLYVHVVSLSFSVSFVWGSLCVFCLFICMLFGVCICVCVCMHCTCMCGCVCLFLFHFVHYANFCVLFLSGLFFCFFFHFCFCVFIVVFQVLLSIISLQPLFVCMWLVFFCMFCLFFSQSWDNRYG